MWATGVKISELEDSLNSYLEKITAYLKDNSLLISAPKSSVTLLTPDTHQTKTHLKILIEDSQLPLVQCPKILGVHMDTSLSVNKHINHVAESIQKKQYPQGFGRDILRETEINITNDIQGGWEIDHQLCCTCLEHNPMRHQLQNIQYTQNEALRIATRCPAATTAHRGKSAENKGPLRAALCTVFD